MVLESSEDGLKKDKSQQELREMLAESNACYVLITCTEPTGDGKMEVEMTYDGDPTLAAYLIESAHGLIDQDTENDPGASLGCRISSRSSGER